MPERLHLIAAEADDVPVLSALLQDAAVRAIDIGYDAAQRRFALLASRYRWEAKSRTRVRAALSIEGVTRVRRKGWPVAPDAVLDLLTIQVEDDELALDFAGGASLRLQVEAIDMLLDDIAGPWAAKREPSHDD